MLPKQPRPYNAYPVGSPTAKPARKAKRKPLYNALPPEPQLQQASQCSSDKSMQFKPKYGRSRPHKELTSTVPIQRKTQNISHVSSSSSKPVYAPKGMNREDKSAWGRSSKPNTLMDFDDIEDSDGSFDHEPCDAKTQSLVVLGSAQAGAASVLSPRIRGKLPNPGFGALQPCFGPESQRCPLESSESMPGMHSEFSDDSKTRRDSYDYSESGHSESQATTVEGMTTAPQCKENCHDSEFDNVEIPDVRAFESHPSDRLLANSQQVSAAKTRCEPPAEKDIQVGQAALVQNSLPSIQGTKLNLNAPFFSPTAGTVATASISSDLNKNNQIKDSKAGLGEGLKSLAQNLESVKNNFTPSTPYVHKFRTEMCKNFELTGRCKYGDECSFAHRQTQLMVKTDVSSLYKTKLCKKFSATGYCPYGIRCQFIHDPSETHKLNGEIEEVVPVNQISKKVTAKIEPQQSPISTPVDPPKKQPLIMPGGYCTAQSAEHLQLRTVVYSQILVRSLNVSVQEYQKKMKMYQKKVQKRKMGDMISPPEMQYMNLYSNSLSRLSCFQQVSAQFEKNIRSKQLTASVFGGCLSDEEELEDEFEGGVFFGDAQSYELHLDKQLKQLKRFSAEEYSCEEYLRPSSIFQVAAAPYFPV